MISLSLENFLTKIASSLYCSLSSLPHFIFFLLKSLCAKNLKDVHNVLEKLKLEQNASESFLIKSLDRKVCVSHFYEFEPEELI